MVLEQPGVHAFLMEPVSTGDDPQFLGEETTHVKYSDDNPKKQPKAMVFMNLCLKLFFIYI